MYSTFTPLVCPQALGRWFQETWPGDRMFKKSFKRVFKKKLKVLNKSIKYVFNDLFMQRLSEMTN